MRHMLTKAKPIINMIRLALVEDNLQDLYLLKSLLEKEEGIHIIATATTGKEGIALVLKYQPDIVVLDIRLPDLSGIECVRKLRPECGNTNFIMYTVFDEDTLVHEAIVAGANAYVLKNSTPDFLIYTIREVHEGRSPMSSDIARKIVNQLQRIPQNNNYSISKREAMVLEELAKGNSYEEIAGALHISVKTIKFHIYRIYEKLQVHNRTQAIKKYYNR